MTLSASASAGRTTVETQRLPGEFGLLLRQRGLSVDHLLLRDGVRQRAGLLGLRLGRLSFGRELSLGYGGLAGEVCLVAVRLLLSFGGDLRGL